MTRIGNWWSWISRLLALGMGVLWMTLGINRLINNAGGILGFMDIGSGITMVVVPFTTVRCSNCGNPAPFDRFYFSTYLQNKFICSDCHTRYKLPVWHTFYLYIILLGLAVAALFGPDINWHGLGTNAILSEGWLFFCALELLLVHILHYAKLDRV